MKYADRSGNRWEKEDGQDRLLKSLYGCAAGRALMRVLTLPAVSKCSGRLLSTRLSRLAVEPTVRKSGIDLSQYEKQSFRSYNEFFTRQIRGELRPVDMDPEILVSPCDGHLSVWPISKGRRFAIKHTRYSLESLLKSRKLAERFAEGYALVFRLTVDNYHRYCYVDDGAKTSNVRIPGILHTVNPIANDMYPIYKENTREYSLLHSRHFGDILMMEVGALMVGKIVNYHGAGQVKKGQEKGRFEFGGSTIVLLVQQGKVDMDRDLMINTKYGYETEVKMGERIGKAP